MENHSLFFLLLWLPWSFFILGDPQLLNSQTQALLQLKKHLEYPKQLDIWYDRRTMFCFLPPSSKVNISCEFHSVTELKIMGDKPSIEVTDFHGFPIPNQTLSVSFSMDSFVTTLTRLTSLKVLSLVSLGIWGPLPNKIHRLSSLECLDLSSNFLFGSIPPKVSTMVKIQTLVLDDNFFNDTVHVFDFTSNLTSLSLKNNKLKQGPLDFSSLTHLKVLDLSGNRLYSHLPTIPKGLIMVSLNRNSFNGEIPTQYTLLTHLQHLDISFNSLIRIPPASLFSFPNISSLNLASNMLSGSLGYYNLTCGNNLEFVDISDNRLTGSLPSCLNSESGNKVVNFSGNCLSIDHHHQHPLSYCRDEVHKDQSTQNANGLGVSISLIVGIVVIIVLLGIAFVIICRHYCHRRISEQHLLHKSVHENSATGFSSEILNNARYISETTKLGTQSLPPCRSFTLEELNQATNNFDNSAFLGEGSYGKLYKGRLEGGSQVAIRCLPTTKKYWIRNLKLRLDMLAKIRHPHLVAILGHCIEVKQDDGCVNRVFLVYEYIPNGNFRSYLSENCVGEVLNWSERLAVLIGVCKAVQFLHTGVIPGFFHNRLKTNNILLNEHRMAKLNDYGLSIISEETNNNCKVKGEDPKSWQMTRLEDDVYSFGLILLETMIGPSLAAKKEGTLRDELACLSKQEGRGRLMNPVVSATASQESISIVISITNKCIFPELWSRPSFEDILWNLQYAAQVQDQIVNKD
ncbi:hypothetical protein ERO13_A07G052100v2 [Gossypium hirsutum]|uniref:Probable inactive leucine-rich repeat receptor-like protein kinase At3g03770 isoform X1 n=1 Tax=Gossypium hirsutum TaxID=3635 RepID=A0A1U8MWS2_GOSHI|nr:probable inactive leucine-rich repeat receptor-like protein kinase At3g03770 isoform X1 [Gossypium hirsutum]KAG4190799.1 hypothetical protein ERO13_A07G052100v2 [Gossypium hirsutum]